MTRDELLARVSDVLRRSGVEDAEKLVRELETSATEAAWGVPPDLVFVLPDPGHWPHSIFGAAPAGLESGAALREYHEPSRTELLRTVRYEIDLELGSKYIWWKTRGGEKARQAQVNAGESDPK